MLAFLRKIRRSLVDSGSAGRYLIYAIGEIALVVIGILIALNVNNYNESQKLDTKITEALKVIHRNLSDNIIESNSIISNYKYHDSLIHEIMTSKFSTDDYRGNKGRWIANVGLDLYPFVLETNGYELLMSNSDRIPERYQQLIQSLKNIYTENSNLLNKTEQSGADYLLEYWSYLGKEMKWFSEYRYNWELSEESINYFTNDPHYKNHLTMYYMLLIQNHYYSIYSFRLNAEDSYQELTDLLQLNNLIASDSTYYNIDVKDYDHFLGTYKDSTDTFTISIVSSKLYCQRNNNEAARLFPISKNSFIQTYDQGFNTIGLDSTGLAKNYNWQIGRRSNSMKKK